MIKIRGTNSHRQSNYPSVIISASGSILWRGKSKHRPQFVYFPEEEPIPPKYILRRAYYPNTRNRYIYIDDIIETIRGDEGRKHRPSRYGFNAVNVLIDLVGGIDSPAGDWCHTWLWEREMV